MSKELLRTVAPLALVIGIGKCFRFHAWKMTDAPEFRRWAKHRHPYGPMFHRHKFFRHWEQPFEKEDAPAEPDATNKGDLYE